MNQSLSSLLDLWLEIGTIVAPQGLRGELRVLSSTDFPQRFQEPGQRWLQPAGGGMPQAVELLAGRSIPGKNLYVIQLAGIEDRNDAEKLRGSKLLVPQGDRPPLAEDEYHVLDLINLEVYHQLTGQNIGIVTNIFGVGQDLLEVRLHQPTDSQQLYPSSLPRGTQGSKRVKNKKKKQKSSTILIPFTKAIVPVVDLQVGRIEIDPPPGLLEIRN